MAFKEKRRWKFLGLPFTFTTYAIDEEYITINRGFLNRTEDVCYMYKVIDSRLESTFMERMFGLGTVICYTADVTNKELKMEHIRNAKMIKDYIVEQSERMRVKRRTLNTMNLNHNEFDEAEIMDHHDFD